MLSAWQSHAQTWDEIIKLTASDAEEEDEFGTSVSISGDCAVVGAYASDDDGDESGSVYVFELDADDAWVEVQKLTASDASEGNSFGISVSINADRMVVGSEGNDVSSGAAYIFERNDDGVWVEIQKLAASDASENDLFGVSVSTSGNYAIIGAFRDDNIAGTDAGAAYIFERNDAGVWTEVQKVMASDASENDLFGISVSIDGNTAIVGAQYNDDSGSAYVFERSDAGVWTEIQEIVSADGEWDDRFGVSVSIKGNYVIIGAQYSDDDGSESGSAYIFEKDVDGIWTEVQKLTASDADADDVFGVSVSIDGDYAIVGSEYNDELGSAYVFQRDVDGTWAEVQKITASDADVDDTFGYSVSISENFAIVGALGNSDHGSYSGSAYIFQGCTDLIVDVSSSMVCEGDEVTLDATSETDDDITWTGGVIDGEAFVPAVGTTTYTATGGFEDCEFQVDITVLESPLVEITADDTVLCEGGMVTLTASGAVTYDWDGGVVDGVAFEPPVGETTYSVIGTNDDDCSSSDSILIIVFENPEVEFTALEDDMVCLDNGLIALSGTPVDGDFSGTGVTGSEFDPNAAGEGTHTLFYSYVDENGCSGIDSVEIDVTDCLGINETEALSFNIYPNPFSDLAVVQFTRNLSADHQVVIYDVLGQEVLREENPNSTQILISKENLNTGVYLIALVESGNILQTHKLVVK